MPTPKRPARPFRQTRRDASKFIESITKAYNPDKEFAQRLIENPVLAFYRYMESRRALGKNSGIEQANIIEVNRFGAFRSRKLTSTLEFREAMADSKAKAPILRRIVEAGVKFRAADTFSELERAECNTIAKGKRFREEFTVSSNDNLTQSGGTFDEYIPIMGGPFSHQLYLHDFLDMLAKSFEAWNHNPYAHQIIRITTCFVLGRGITFKAKSPEVQKAFQKWWHDNDMDGRLESWSDMLSRDGELIIRRYRNPITGAMFLRWVDPSTVWEIVTDIEDIETEYYYHQQYPAAYQVLYGAPAGAKFDPMRFECTRYIINQIPADEVYHVKINVSPNEKRGRSDLFCNLGWLKRHKDFQTGQVLKAIVQSVFAWKNKLKGSQTDVDTFVQQFGTDVPDFGSLWTENDASELTAMTADAKGGNSLPDAPGLVQTIAVGAGIPKEYLGASESGTRATAVVASEPGVKKFQSRQLLLGRLLRKISRGWFKNEVASGRLKAQVPSTQLPSLMVPLDGDIDFMFPEIAVEDRTAKIADLTAAKDEKVIDHERYAVAVAKELGMHDYDYKDAQDKVTEDQANDLGGLYTPPSEKPGMPGNEQAPVPEAAPKPSGGLSGEERASVKLGDRR